MSVLVEAVSIVVKRAALDCKYPGGTAEFLCMLASRRSAEHRFVCSDTNLICLSYFTPDAADRGAETLLKAGLIDIDDNEFIDFAMVDQHYGPTLQCTWLAWQREPPGFTRAWLAGELPGGLSVPDGWTPEGARNIKRIDIREIPDKAMKLAEENGVETWLDFTTGRITTGRP
ncbi:MAG TPA: hypothetical protein VF042_16960 [Gemmatimonadaceae bacterium]